MGNEMKWEADLVQAIARAGSENKPILLDFFNPG